MWIMIHSGYDVELKYTVVIVCVCEVEVHVDRDPQQLLRLTQVYCGDCMFM